MMNDPAGAPGLFAKFDYAETKDLAKSFLTLSSTVLAFSVTFSEKIVDFKTARSEAKFAMMASWVLNVTSIALCGLSICYLANSLSYAVYGGDFETPAQISYLLLLASGSMFVASLVSLVVSAIISLAGGPRSESGSA